MKKFITTVTKKQNKNERSVTKSSLYCVLGQNIFHKNCMHMHMIWQKKFMLYFMKRILEVFPWVGLSLEGAVGWPGDRILAATSARLRAQ